MQILGTAADVNLNKISVLYNDSEEKVRLVYTEKPDNVLLEVSQDCEFFAFFRLVYYFEKHGKLENIVDQPIYFCGYELKWVNLLEIFMFIELFKQEYTHIVMCYETYQDVDE